MKHPLLPYAACCACLALVSSCTSESELSKWRAEQQTAAPAQIGQTEAAPAPPELAPEPEPETPELTAIDPDVAVESGEGEVTLWLTDKASGKKVQKLLSQASQGMSAQFSSDKKWIVVSDQAFSDLQTVHLFKRAGATSYRQIDREAFTGVVWDQFAGEKLGPQFMITRYITNFEGWGEGEQSLRLKLGAHPREGDWIEKEYTVDLTDL